MDRSKTGSKHRIIVEAHGIQLSTITTGDIRNGVTRLILLIETVPPIRGVPNHYAARGYDHDRLP